MLCRYPDCHEPLGDESIRGMHPKCYMRAYRRGEHTQYSPYPSGRPRRGEAAPRLKASRKPAELSEVRP
jgi:hypothetical protein